MSLFECYTDSRGLARVRTVDLHLNVSRFFEQDVQRNLSLCHEIMNAIKEADGGQESEWTGNAFTVTVTRHTVRIESLWDDSSGVATTPIEEFNEWIATWADFLGRSDHQS